MIITQTMAKACAVIMADVSADFCTEIRCPIAIGQRLPRGTELSRALALPVRCSIDRGLHAAEPTAASVTATIARHSYSAPQFATAVSFTVLLMAPADAEKGMVRLKLYEGVLP
jgi:hypothetical protein